MDSLEPKAEYGRIAFDIFALEEWDYSRPRYADAEQWSMLVQKYLALQPRERTVYTARAAFRYDLADATASAITRWPVRAVSAPEAGGEFENKITPYSRRITLQGFSNLTRPSRSATFVPTDGALPLQCGFEPAMNLH
ncbi:hypothetical protein CEP52_013810 [Fusarium oligoseptatum]|uniref:Uncharacterized protein n=1 Tax=Fusarium oligoseptatum TaxID=2604345 RepID=A0A428SRX9_9HYPO|nr:hypothetical protein CEP52_013810 [Fusarium oligoseptatum]